MSAGIGQNTSTTQSRLSGDAARFGGGEVAHQRPPETAATPSMQQYLEIKTANPDSLLWYRMGDFYELFFEDAVVAAEALAITLTKRGKHVGEDIPMCGVPVVRADEYLQRLIRQGFRVAVCEQLEDPAEARKRGAKAVVKRDVVRLVTPGTLTEDALLDAKARNFLIALLPRLESDGSVAEVAMAAFELSTGELEIGTVSALDFSGEMARLQPREVLVADTSGVPPDLGDALMVANAAVTPVPRQSFDSACGKFDLEAALGVSDLTAFGDFSRTEFGALGALLRYVALTQVGQRPVVRPPVRLGTGTTVVIDAATRASLELVRSASGDRKGSLLSAMDRTVTGAGARELAARLSAPLIELHAINTRLDAVGHFVGQDILRTDLRAILKRCPDLARAISRLSLGRGGPRDLGAMRDGLEVAAEIARLLPRSSADALPRALRGVLEAIAAVPPTLHSDLDRALADELPLLTRDGGFIATGYSEGLDQARAMRDDSRAVIAGLEAKYIDQSGVKGLKVRHNNILGYFLEAGTVSAKPLLDPPLSETFRHRQTMANAIRFTTTELIDIEGRIAAARDRAHALELEAFATLAGLVRDAEHQLLNLTNGLAELDCTAALAELAAEQGYTRPELTDTTRLTIVGGRHPVVEQALKAQAGDAFIVNDCLLGDQDGIARPPGFEEERIATLWLVTGPNMAGKSTFLRQNALIVLMAQMGAFVPADQAVIGIVDRLFSRVGASDDLARGRSTFMVEMVETAAILTQATAQSLVVLDEVGRGTATFDGLSIAWAAVEHLHDTIGCRALFATHYHEMTALADRLSGVANVTMDVREYKDEIVFLHRVRPGAADRSYGIQVARLAGLPAPVVKRAGEVLAALEASDEPRTGQHPLDDLPLFSVARPTSVGATRADGDAASNELAEAVHAIAPDELTPRAALDLIYKLKALSKA